MKKSLRALLLLILVGILLMTGVFVLMSSKVNELEKRDYAGLDTTSIPDGVYRGEAEALLIKAEVEVSVRGGQLESIELIRHSHGRGEAAEIITEHMVEQNTVDVDTISGATASSVVIKAAVFDALEQKAKP